MTASQSTDRIAYSTTRPRLEAFAQEHGARPASSAREAIEGADVVALATNAYEPVLEASWLEPGQHVGSVQGHELDEATLERADLVVVRSREEATFHFAPSLCPSSISFSYSALPSSTWQSRQIGIHLFGLPSRSRMPLSTAPLKSFGVCEWYSR